MDKSSLKEGFLYTPCIYYLPRSPEEDITMKLRVITLMVAIVMVAGMLGSVQAATQPTTSTTHLDQKMSTETAPRVVILSKH